MHPSARSAVADCSHSQLRRCTRGDCADLTRSRSVAQRCHPPLLRLQPALLARLRGALRAALRGRADSKVVGHVCASQAHLVQLAQHALYGTAGVRDG